MRWQGLFLAALLAMLAGCDRGPPPPEKAFQDFVAAAAAGNHERAWSLLSEETRKSADALVEATRDALTAAGETPPANGRELLFGSGGVELVRELDDVAVVTVEGPVARLAVRDASGTSQPVEMRLENGAWRVHLPLGG